MSTADHGTSSNGAMTAELGTLVRVDPMSVFAGGNALLTQWIAQHLDVVGSALDMDLEPAASGGAPGADNDVVARDLRRDRIVILCSQVTPSDEHQLGRLLTMAGDKSAHAVVWVGPELRRSHRQALRWFNSQSPEDGIKFYALGLELFRVDNSKPGVALRLFEGPEDTPDADSFRGGRNGHFDTGRGEGEELSQRPDDVESAVNGSARSGIRDAIDEVPAAAHEARTLPPDAPLDRPPIDAVDHEIAAQIGEPRPDSDPQGGAEGPAAAAGDQQQDSYRKFFQRMADDLREKYRISEARPAQAQNWYSLPSSVSGIIYSIWFSGNGRIRAELYIDVGDREANREIFARLQAHAPEIEHEYGSRLDWDASQGGRAYTVSVSLPGKIDDPAETLEKNLKWATAKLVSFKEVFGRRLPLILRSLAPKMSGARPPAPAARPRV